MRQFIKIPINSDCCQMYGICGEQYSLDITFNDDGKVETTRFRFMHQPMKSQQDYIDGLVETRRATDKYAPGLVQNQVEDIQPVSIEKALQAFERPSMASKVASGFRRLMHQTGFGD